MSAPMKSPSRLLGISGSLRKGLHSMVLLMALSALVNGRAMLQVMTLHDVRLYEAGLDGDELPPGAAQLKRATAAADGLVVVSPKYNYGNPGVLKNAIDWASRPGFKSPLKGEPALVITASHGLLGEIGVPVRPST